MNQQAAATDGNTKKAERRLRPSVKDTRIALEAADRVASGVLEITFPGEAVEAGPLVQETKRLYQQMMYELVDLSGQPEEIAHAHATKPASDNLVERVQATVPQEMNWGILTLLMHRDPALAVVQWERIKADALAQVHSGYAAAAILETSSSRSPYELAMFLAVRQTLRQEWMPQNGIEIILIDKIAQVHVLQMRWMTRLVQFSNDDGWMDEFMAEAGSAEKKRRSHVSPSGPAERWQEPRVSQAKALAVAAEQVDRFDRMFVRLVRTLRDLRRFLPTPAPTPPSVTINNPAQVNVGQQQINVSTDAEPIPAVAAPLP